MNRCVRVGIAAVLAVLGWGPQSSVESFAGGAPDQPASDIASAGTDSATFARLMAKGDQIATNTCKQCHGQQGEGMVGPPLRQNLQNARAVVRTVIQGNANMPPLGSTMSDEDLAAVVTYVRNSWGNSFGVVTEQQVAEFKR